MHNLPKPLWLSELVAVWGYVQRNYFLTKRYLMWEIVWLVYVTVNGVRRNVTPFNQTVSGLDVSAWFKSGANTLRPSSTSDIRAWAQANGLGVSSRGRVSADVREAYEKAQV